MQYMSIPACLTQKYSTYRDTFRKVLAQVRAAVVDQTSSEDAAQKADELVDVSIANFLERNAFVGVILLVPFSAFFATVEDSIARFVLVAASDRGAFDETRRTSIR